jgi:hypothetical protein
MRRAYQFMLLLYPRGHRDQFAEEMAGVFEEARNERLYQGWAWYARFAFSEMAGLIGGAASAWFDQRRSPEASIASGSGDTLPHDLLEAQQRIDLNIARMVHAIANHQFEKARVYSNEERRARENLRLLRQKYGLTN